eukprot:scaffold34072_cov49-Phaeocystis_antarctica.AAC.3
MLSVETPRASTEHGSGGKSAHARYAPPPSPNEGGREGASPSVPWGHCMRMCTAPGRALCALLPILIRHRTVALPPEASALQRGHVPVSPHPPHPGATVATILLAPKSPRSHSLPIPPPWGSEHPTHGRALALCVLSSDDKPATEAEPPATTISLHPYPLHPPEDGSGGDGGEGEE